MSLALAVGFSLGFSVWVLRFRLYYSNVLGVLRSLGLRVKGLGFRVVGLGLWV